MTTKKLQVELQKHTKRLAKQREELHKLVEEAYEILQHSVEAEELLDQVVKSLGKVKL